MKPIITFLFLFLPILIIAQPSTVNNWQYLQIDDQKAKWGDWDQPNWLRYFGLDMGDVNGE